MQKQTSEKIKLFYYQIKGCRKDKYEDLGWSWPPVWQDIVEAESKKELREILESEHKINLPQRVLRKNLDTGMFLLNIQEIQEGDYTHSKLTKIHVCKICSTGFTILEKYKIDDGFYSTDHCSRKCYEIYKEKEREFRTVIEGVAVPLVYRITNKITEKCYIGQTAQPFTLRWWNHFAKHNNSSAKFRKEIEKTKLSDWTFEVLEVAVTSQDLNTIEAKFIEKYNSISSGYNTVNAPNSKLI